MTSTSSLAIAALCLAAWGYLRYGRGRFWDISAHFLSHAAEPKTWPAVAVVIPARDEERIIGLAVRSYLAQEYPGALHLVVVDDGSTDDTTAQARKAAGESASVTVLAGAPRPPGWTGKTWAMHQGTERAQRICADASWLWFTDADIVHAPDTLRRLVATGERAPQPVMVSLMARLSCTGFWEQLLIPPFIFFFQKLYPFAWVNDVARGTAAAAGGCALVRRQSLDAAGGIAAIRDCIIDDCALAALLKPHGPLWLGLTNSSHSLRAYTRLREIWGMVARTAYAALRYSPMLLVCALLGMLLVYPLPWLLLAFATFTDEPVNGALACAAIGMQLFCFRPTVSFYGLPAWWAATLPVAALLYMAMTVDSAWRHRCGRGGAWKGRTFDPSEDTFDPSKEMSPA